MKKHKEAGFPAYYLNLKVGSPVMLVRILSTRDGLVNGTRLLVTKIFIHDRAKCVECIIVTGKRTGEKVPFHRIEFYQLKILVRYSSHVFNSHYSNVMQ